MAGITGWLRQTVYLYASAGVDDYAEPSWGAPVTVDARVVQKTIRRIAADGKKEDTVQVTTVLVPGSTSVTVGDKIELPDGTVAYVTAIEPTVQGTTTLLLTLFVE